MFIMDGPDKTTPWVRTLCGSTNTLDIEIICSMHKAILGRRGKCVFGYLICLFSRRGSLLELQPSRDAVAAHKTFRRAHQNVTDARGYFLDAWPGLCWVDNLEGAQSERVKQTKYQAVMGAKIDEETQLRCDVNLIQTDIFAFSIFASHTFTKSFGHILFPNISIGDR